ncbi:hypothetical protein AMECASPLE_003309 [Ameca splendens]|uniref:Uncharacterized protein n=1 Tax=Ameca splendens TaxID=208324 RepID=A0ABV0XMK9_9TELE
METPCVTLSFSARFSATPLCGQHQSEHFPACLSACMSLSSSDQQAASPGSSPDGRVITSQQRGTTHNSVTHIFVWTKKYHWLVCCMN